MPQKQATTKTKSSGPKTKSSGPKTKALGRGRGKRRGVGLPRVRKPKTTRGNAITYRDPNDSLVQ